MESKILIRNYKYVLRSLNELLKYVYNF